MHLGRRRFIAIASAAALAAPARAETVTQWRGVALGASASIALAHPEAGHLIEAALAEIDRLENIFSLYRAGSVLSRLNAEGAIEAPPFELLECLALAGVVHGATQGAFDPSIQPLWAAHAEAWAAGGAPTGRAVAAALRRVGWPAVRISPSRIGFGRAGMALTLNGIAQGWIADRVAALLRDAGIGDVRVETGEIHALGRAPDGGGWPVTLSGGGALRLSDRSLATSATLGTTFDPAGLVGHILDPRSGMPAPGAPRQITVSAPSAALADALSTALCLLPEPQAAGVLARFPAVRIERDRRWPLTAPGAQSR